MDSSKNKIDSFNILRAIAFMGIFMRHVEFKMQWAALGVSVFFVLSGFLLTYQYVDRDENLGGGGTKELGFCNKEGFKDLPTSYFNYDGSSCSHIINFCFWRCIYKRMVEAI